ncbi:MAG: MerR family transcriptional regulator [Sedimentibacter sp.]|uniref:MerR family transcriptional regulator n=1 Tax=Sedimentibacter sp. TaxID=1960295 RepID=UPI0031590336
MYKINEFAKMTGLSQSKVRFYEKNGLLHVHKDKNGYRYFTRWDAFRVNAFRTLKQYGFTVEQAVKMLDEKHSELQFINSLEERKEDLQKQIEIMNHRMSKLDTVINYLKEGYSSNFEIMEVEDHLYVLASNGTDFSVSFKSEKILAQFVDLLSISSFARIIYKDDLLSENECINPSYAHAIPISKEYLLGKYDKTQVKKIHLGRCICYYRKATREKSENKESFHDLFEFMEKNNYEICKDILLLPTFLNLDGKGSDIEVLYVPIKK